MTEIEYSQASEATALCKACGLCCTGHLFSWVQLKAIELTPLEKLGLNVIRSDPRQRGFTQPCPMWNGICTIYDSPHYPRGCDSYKCKLLRELLDESVSLLKALRVVKQAKERIQVVEKLLPASVHSSFRDRFVEQVEYLNNSPEAGAEESKLRQKADELLDVFKDQFGVNDFFDLPKAL
jgi:hypothetical protein